MKLAEALTKIKDLKGKVASLNLQINSDSTFQKLDELTEVPSVEGLLTELTEVLAELRSLKTKVDTANVKSGLADKIHEMEQLRYAIKTLEGLSRLKQETRSLTRLDYGTPPVPVTTVATFNVANLNSQLEVYRRRVRELDLELQRLNWQIDA